MVQNVQSAFGSAEKSDQHPRTDFSEPACPFTIADGVVDAAVSLKSPFIRVDAKGQADLVKKMLDFRAAPKFVAILKGQGDIQPHSGLMVSVKITGSFADTSFRPDLGGKQKLPAKALEGVPRLPLEDLTRSLPLSPLTHESLINLVCCMDNSSKFKILNSSKICRKPLNAGAGMMPWIWSSKI